MAALPALQGQLVDMPDIPKLPTFEKLDGNGLPLFTCTECGKTKRARYFRYTGKPVHVAHLNPRLFIGQRCNRCRIAWIKQDLKRIANAKADAAYAKAYTANANAALDYANAMAEAKRTVIGQHRRDTWDMDEWVEDLTSSGLSFSR